MFILKSKYNKLISKFENVFHEKEKENKKTVELKIELQGSLDKLGGLKNRNEILKKKNERLQKESILSLLIEELLENNPEKITQTYILDELERLASLEFELVENLRGKLKNSSAKIAELQIGLEKFERNSKALHQLESNFKDEKEKQNSLKNKLNETEATIEEMEIVLGHKTKAVDSLASRNTELEIINSKLNKALEKFNSISPEYVLVLRSISELKNLRSELKKEYNLLTERLTESSRKLKKTLDCRLDSSPGYNKAHRRIRAAILYGERAYKEAKEKELELGVLEEFEILDILSDNIEKMPENDKRLERGSASGLYQGGGHVRYSNELYTTCRACGGSTANCRCSQ